MPYRPTERSQARKAHIRERIVGAALDQVAAGGYASTSVAEIAGRAGVATGSVYRHFPSKTDLLAEVFRQVAGRELEVIERLAGEAGPPVRERLAACVEAFARRALAGPVLAYAQIAEPLDLRLEHERLALRRGYRDAFARLLREGIEAGELTEHDPELMAAGLIGAIAEALVGPLSPALGGSRPRRPEALIASLVQFCLNAVPREESHDADRAPVHA